jgi:uncharacterized membrane-anchored protein YhcB (DUF1043 family)
MTWSLITDQTEYTESGGNAEQQKYEQEFKQYQEQLDKKKEEYVKAEHFEKIPHSIVSKFQQLFSFSFRKKGTTRNTLTLRRIRMKRIGLKRSRFVSCVRSSRDNPS